MREVNSNIIMPSRPCPRKQTREPGKVCDHAGKQARIACAEISPGRVKYTVEIGPCFCDLEENELGVSA